MIGEIRWICPNQMTGCMKMQQMDGWVDGMHPVVKVKVKSAEGAPCMHGDVNDSNE